ncbi:MAG: hypothetical protein QGG33_10145 [Candidatus Krumholzibacteria bacterium]|nr:hypothetical protein [Candidatus Krumholzibacteria bacterium]MDP7022313.1 hypothetical protein [Candidatus Krumholzibacteria bacterium]
MIRLNLLFAAVYNLAAVAMSIAGLVNPLVSLPERRGRGARRPIELDAPCPGR